ncbi:MAG: hypothetical protein M3Z26_06515 [Bacteroidota bacterium]|nr:hypothetical protein [Bacteroidota bacterium]
MKYFTLPSLYIYLLSLVFASCNTNDLPNEQFVLTTLNNEIKPPLAYTDLKKIDGLKSDQLGQDVYWIKYKVKLVAGNDLHVFTKRGSAGMDTFYVADSDSSFLKKISNDINATTNYNKQFGEFTSSYKKIKAFNKGDLIKEEIGGINFIKTEKGWNKMK